MKIIVSILISVVVSISACRAEDSGKYEYFTVRIDSVKTTESVNLNDNVVIELYGTIGGDGRFSLERIETSPRESFTEVRVVGKFDKSMEIATAALVELNGARHSLQATNKGDFIIRILQPDKSFIEKKIVVR